MFAGKVAIVTGASSGIGRATAQLLAGRGALVAVMARSEEKLAELASERILAVTGDVADPEAVERLFAAAESRFGSCEILINNAGMVDPRPLLKTTLEEWELAFAVNVTATFLTTRRALPAMLAAGRGSIVNVASISGVPGTEKFPGFTAYCASKAAVISMSEALAVEVKGRGVRVNCVSPGSVDTRMWAAVSNNAPASMTPAEVAETIAFLASDASQPMNGQNLHVWSA
ncbi:MAG TPA: SDR family oxidoreductase [Thermoanaerobaculia bacterium]|jgi:3-oxoacyl-[acyl-carrier protein] reductase|nr:SDR family oxidoreductase [Thermoanaerobaculia bacterium]